MIRQREHGELYVKVGRDDALRLAMSAWLISSNMVALRLVSYEEHLGSRYSRISQALNFFCVINAVLMRRINIHFHV